MRLTQLLPAILLLAFSLAAQPTFNSGSTGADGALNITGPSGTVVIFDPTKFNPPLNPSGNNIYNFTTINIAAGVTVKLTSKILTGPVYWLAQGAVTINGTIDLKGEDGANASTVANTRIPAYGGAGGFSGGLAGRIQSTLNIAATAGNGPGGGTPTNNATFTGNTLLIPMVGGSGGGGGSLLNSSPVGNGPGGGAGGGAILIASSTSIAFGSGASILVTGGNGGAQGGNSTPSGGGSGGAIRLVAPAVSGGVANLYANGGIPSNLGSSAQNGRIRVETASMTCNCNMTNPYTVTSVPNLYLPTVTPGSVKVLSVGGVALPAAPTGSFTLPDVSINSNQPVTINLGAANIPLGTTVTLLFNSETTADFSATSTPLAGSVAASTATATVTFPSGFSRGFVKATW